MKVTGGPGTMQRRVKLKTAGELMSQGDTGPPDFAAAKAVRLLTVSSAGDKFITP